MITISRKERQLIQKIKAVMAAEQTQFITDEQLWNIDPDNEAGEELIEKEVLLFNPDPDCKEKSYVLTKDDLQVMDDDPEVEQAWEDFRAVRGNGSMAELYTNTDKHKVLEANKHLEEVLFKKGRLTHMIDRDYGHIWVTEDKVSYWKNRGWKEACPEAVPIGLQA